MKNFYFVIFMLLSTISLSQTSYKMKVDTSIRVYNSNAKIISCVDGGIAIGALQQLNSDFVSFIYKMDANGNYLWSKHYDQNIPDFVWNNAIQIKATSDSGFYFLTQAELDMFGWFSTPQLQKINKDGVVTSTVKTSATGSWGNDLYLSAVEKYNNNLYGWGATSSYDPINDEPCCFSGYSFKFDTTLNLLRRWSTNFLLYDSLDIPFFAYPTQDSNYIWNGFNLYDSSGYQFSTIQYDIDSNQAFNYPPRAYCQDNSNFYFLETVSFNSIRKACLHKTDKHFNTVFSIVLDTSNNLYPLNLWGNIEMDKGQNGNIFISTLVYNGNSNKLPYMMEIDTSGSIIHSWQGDGADSLFYDTAVDTISGSVLFVSHLTPLPNTSLAFQREFLSSPSCGFIPVTINTFPITITDSIFMTSDTLAEGVYPIVTHSTVPEVSFTSLTPTPICGVLSGNQEPEQTKSCIATLYPNPANDKLSISFHCDLVQNAEVKIYNILGDEVLRKKIAVSSGEKKIDVRDFPAGIYLVKILTTDGNVFNNKIIIQK